MHGSDNSKNLRLIKQQDLMDALEKAFAEEDNTAISLRNIVPQSHPLAELHIQATPWKALTIMDKHQVDSLYVSGYISGPYPDNGIVSRSDIEHFYHRPQ